MTAKDVMTKHVAWIKPESTVREAASKMEKFNIGALPVISHNKQLVEIISLGGLAVKGGQKVACEVLEKVSQPSK